MKIHIYVNIKKISKEYLEAVSEYFKRLGPYCMISLISSTSKTDVLRSIKGMYTICIEDDFETISSTDFSEKIAHLSMKGKTSIAFLIGYEGIKADETLSLVSTSLDIQLKAVLLSEQIYRSYMISNNRLYHK